jgi:hypothetical protein
VTKKSDVTPVLRAESPALSSLPEATNEGDLTDSVKSLMIPSHAVKSSEGSPTKSVYQEALENSAVKTSEISKKSSSSTLTVSSAEKETNFAHFIIIAVAKFTFEATTKDEIDFEKGDELSDVVAAEDEGWSKGKNRKTGKTGYFPTNYVKLIKKEIPAPKVEKKKKQPPPLAPRKARTPTPPPITPKAVLLEARYAYAALQKDELSFKKGDILKLVTKNTGQGEAWWKGELKNKPADRLSSDRGHIILL